MQYLGPRSRIDPVRRRRAARRCRLCEAMWNSTVGEQRVLSIAGGQHLEFISSFLDVAGDPREALLVRSNRVPHHPIPFSGWRHLLPRAPHRSTTAPRRNTRRGTQIYDSSAGNGGSRRAGGGDAVAASPISSFLVGKNCSGRNISLCGVPLQRPTETRPAAPYLGNSPSRPGPNPPRLAVNGDRAGWPTC